MVSEIKHVENNGKIKNYKVKKAIALILAGVTTIGAGTAIANLSGCSKKDNITDETTDILKLLEDFDINDEKQVRQRAQDIYDLSEKEFSVEEIMNMIYVANGRYDLIKFNSNDDAEKFEQIQNLILSYVKLFNDNIFDDIEALSDPSVKPNEDDEIYAYMLIASGEEKAKVIELAEIINNQLIAIKNQDTSVYEKNAREFYDLYSSIINDKNISDYTRHLVSKYVSQVNSLFIPFLSKEEVDFLNKNDNLSNSVGSDIVDEAGIDTQKVLDKVGEDCGNKVTPNGKSYGDAADASTKVPAGSQAKEEVIDNGGKHVETQTVESEPTTSKAVETTVANITIPSKEEDYKEFVEDFVDSTISEGAEIVIEEIPDEGIVVEILDEGGEVVQGEKVHFVDAEVPTTVKALNQQ